jgi:hypothetical protein
LGAGLPSGPIPMAAPFIFGWARLAGHLMLISAARALGLSRITAAWAPVLEKFLSWDIWVPAAIAVAAVFIILIFDLQALLIVVIFLALGGYIAAYTMIDGRNEF